MEVPNYWFLPKYPHPNPWPRPNFTYTNDSYFWEKVDPDWCYWFAENYAWLPYAIVLTYLTSVYGLTLYMKNRRPVKAEKLTPFLVLQNFLCSLSAGLVLLRFCVPRLVKTYHENSDFPKFWHFVMCESMEINQKEAFYGMLSGWSKILHLGDTIFLVLKKRNVPFFHLFHHSALIFVPMSMFPYAEPVLFIFCFFNMVQHVFTYPILLMKSLKIPVFPGSSQFLLTLELIQMLVGLVVGGYTIYVLETGGSCLRHPVSIAIFNFLYIVMGLLLLQMVYKRNFTGNSRRNDEIKKKT